MLDDALLADWCLRYLGAPFERVLFRSGFLSDVVGVELPGGLRAVVKARPFPARDGDRGTGGGHVARADETASVAESADFITSYQLQAGREREASEVRDAWAAGLWLGLVFAEQEAAEGGSQQLDRLAGEIDERLHRAALK